MSEPPAIDVSIVGATGYAGAELLRFLTQHPGVRVRGIIGASKAGKPITEVLPSFRGVLEGDVQAFDADRVADESQVAFCALPHGASAGIVSELRDRGLVVFDLSADFRLRDADVYAEWYGEHRAPQRFGQATYGLVELYRESLRTADLIAVPGCYPTAAILALAPLVKAGLIDASGIVVDAKSGVTGAGRSPSAKTHLPECAEGIRAYKIGAHRHGPEIDQELTALGPDAIRVLFTPHLVPMSRGILATAYAMAKPETTTDACIAAAEALYADSPFVSVLDAGQSPDTLWVRGSNRAHVSYQVDARTGRVIALSAIDNLAKGTASQAVQAMNIRFGFDEATGIGGVAQWP